MRHFYFKGKNDIHLRILVLFIKKVCEWFNVLEIVCSKVSCWRFLIEQSSSVIKTSWVCVIKWKYYLRLISIIQQEWKSTGSKYPDQALEIIYTSLVMLSHFVVWLPYNLSKRNAKITPGTYSYVQFFKQFATEVDIL